MKPPVPTLALSALAQLAALAALAPAELVLAQQAPPVTKDAPSASSAVPRLVATVTGLSGPEAVKYDPVRDVYYVSNFGPSAGTPTDNNGFISRVNPDGTMRDLRWAVGTDGQSTPAAWTLHMPRGMAIGRYQLWVADADGVAGFDLEQGRMAGKVSFANRDVGFLNDLAFGPDSLLYVTDTGRNRIYRFNSLDPNADRTIEVALADTALGAPNGITLDRRAGRFVLLPYGGRSTLHAWRPGTTTVETLLTGSGAQYDGVEIAEDGAIIVSSQRDSSIHVYRNGVGGPVIRGLPGRPADIALDTRRNRVAIPYIALNKVEIWELPR